ncbi:UNVERIFIED_CONTAM: Chaperone protein DnaJ [Sesamum calycinum]|uniref:Chaperone protein DnaJ n=1 Tax=Sesamum calycinum TaxID=2727403 RepID=A0AAW2LSP3_9LAMI
MLTTVDVYVSAENKISGEIDWYGVLGVSPSSDDETIRKQYRKLALMLHPDKNKSVGSDGAFKLISEAWSFYQIRRRGWRIINGGALKDSNRKSRFKLVVHQHHPGQMVFSTSRAGRHQLQKPKTLVEGTTYTSSYSVSSKN